MRFRFPPQIRSSRRKSYPPQTTNKVSKPRHAPRTQKKAKAKYEGTSLHYFHFIDAIRYNNDVDGARLWPSLTSPSAVGLLPTPLSGHHQHRHCHH